MNFKRFGRTANLFDEANLEGGVYLASNGNKYGSITDGVRSGVKINVLPNTQYTLSLYSNMNISIRILQWSGETYITHSPKYNISGNVSLTIATNSTTDKIAFNVEGVNGQYAENLMLNEGSTVLPYQPYMDWTNTPHYIMGTDTDTLTTLPAVLYPNDTTATVGLKGQMEQSSTPSPTTPIQPQECGERTGNLFDYSTVTTGYRIQWITGDDYPDDTAVRSDYIPVSSGTYSCLDSVIVLGYDASKNFIGATNGDGVFEKIAKNPTSQFIIPTNSLCKYVKILAFDSSVPMNIDAETMLNSGSSALPYEPYGYKIPILNNSQTTNVYLGEVESTRQIKKVVFTGSVDETWNRAGSTHGYFTNLPSTAKLVGASGIISSHYQPSMSGADGTIRVAQGSVEVLIYDNYTSVADFKAYLAQQYANGTPVTVWYVLATETTGIVNEPLRKIGDYADTVSGISIPVTAGSNTLSIDTTLQPSEVTVNYKGWHPVSAVHERENGAWT